MSIFSFEGRIGRGEYFLSLIGYAVGYGILLAYIESANDPGLELLFFIPLIWFLWAQGAKRCHDVGNSGWMQIVPFYIFWMLLEGGYRGPNKFGPDPKGAVQASKPINHQVVHSNSIVAPTPMVVPTQPIPSPTYRSTHQVTILEVQNVNYSLVQDILKSLRKLNEINDLSYEFSGTTATVTINHSDSSQKLLENLNSFMDNIEVLGVGNSSLKIKLT